MHIWSIQRLVHSRFALYLGVIFAMKAHNVQPPSSAKGSPLRFLNRSQLRKVCRTTR